MHSCSPQESGLATAIEFYHPTSEQSIESSTAIIKPSNIVITDPRGGQEPQAMLPGVRADCASPTARTRPRSE